MKFKMEEAGLVYKTVHDIRGPLLFVEGVKNVAFDELVKVQGSNRHEVLGKVLDVSEKTAVIEIFGSVAGLSLDVGVRFTGETLKIPVSDELVGRIFDGKFKPIDGLAPPTKGEKREIYEMVMNPYARSYPKEFIQTGISSIDGMNTLIQGQKLPIFSEEGLPHDQLVAQLVRQATIPGKEEEFVIVFGGIGITHEEYTFFRDEFKKTGILDNSIMIVNLASDPPLERIITPRIALTIAEYLALDLDMSVLVFLTNMTNYCEALRTVSVAREEIPSRKGYPGYMYSDLATIYERAGLIKGKKGSVTLMPILTMPGGDITHPIPDLTGYITEGQLILDRTLYINGIHPPLNVLPSLSRLMKDGIGVGKTREDHREVSAQLYMAYAEGVKARGLARIIGEFSLSAKERNYLEFAEEFERKFVNQGIYENRTIEDTLDISWDLLDMLPEESLVRIRREQVEKYYPKYRKVK